MRKIEQVKMRKDFERLLAIVADARQVDYSEVETIAQRNGYEYDEHGAVVKANG